MRDLGELDDLDRRITLAARRYWRARQRFDRRDQQLRAVLREARAAGKGPSRMSRLTGLTREWIAKLAPRPGGD